MNTRAIKTKEGTFTATFSERGLARLDFPGSKRAAAAHASSASAAQLDRWQTLTADALEKILAGKKPAALPPLDWTGATDFQQRVWKELLSIEPGRSKTYTQIATAAGKPSAARAAGSACGANPIPVLVPCHRVIAADGGLGGFSGGLDWKRRLLAREGVALAL